LSVALFEKTPILQALAGISFKKENDDSWEQLNLLATTLGH